MIVTVKVPVVAVELAVNVRVEEQFGLQLPGENVAVTPVRLGGKEADRLTRVVEEVSEKGRTTETTVEMLPD